MIATAKAGDMDARDDLFRELETYLKIVTRQQFNQELNAKLGQSDVIQQTLLNAADKFSDFRGQTGAEFKAWIKQILIREVRGSERKFFSDKRNVRLEQVTSNDVDSLPEHIQNVADSLPTPRTNAIGEEQSKLIHNALDRLPEDYRQVIQMRNWQGLSFRKIGIVMKRSENAATKLWIRALAQLQEEIETNASPDESQPE